MPNLVHEGQPPYAVRLFCSSGPRTLVLMLLFERHVCTCSLMGGTCVEDAVVVVVLVTHLPSASLLWYKLMLLGGDVAKAEQIGLYSRLLAGRKSGSC